MINETKNTSANEWRFDEGCEKSPSARKNTRTSTIHLNQYNDASKIVF